MRSVRILIFALLAAAVATGCSAIPNMDHGSSGCSNARGIGPPDGGFVSDPAIIGKSPTEAAAVAQAAGHTVVFNVPIHSYGECWCVPPPEGTVVDGWWGQNGQLFLQVTGVDEGHTADQQPPRGWGC